MGELGGSAWLVLLIAGLWLAIAGCLARACRFAGCATRIPSLPQRRPWRPCSRLPQPGRCWSGRTARSKPTSGCCASLSLKRPPGRWATFRRGQRPVEDDDLETLRDAVEARRLSGTPIERQVRAAGSNRIFEVRGGPAPAPEPAGTMLLWFSDTSAAEAERSKLALRIRQTEAALDSLTHLIEAAPFPMWYRGPDLQARPRQPRLRRGGRRRAMLRTSSPARPS